MEIYESHLKQIVKANNEKRLAIFVGSGVSLSSNTDSFKLPLWNDLIEGMKEELFLKNENDYLKIAQLYFLEFGEANYYAKIQEYFPDNISPSEVHKIVFELRPQYIVTTNWDCILEDAIVETGAQYDVICSDKDLVKSSRVQKLIKMHGDFKNHNVVFKEDDYLNYSFNFPLIENYIKSILSTNTILFIGYSYSDINLKHIMKWVQKHSDYCPPMYLATSKHNYAQNQYLNSHRIKSLILPEELNQLSERFDGLIEKRSKQLAFFLEDLKLERLRAQRELTLLDSAEFIFGKLSHLQTANSVLLEQIRAALSNCGFTYLEGYPVLKLFRVDGVLTTNYDKNTRVIFEKFIELLTKYKSGEKVCKKTKQVIDKIMKVLAKSHIGGITLHTESDGSGTYIVNDHLEKDLLNTAVLDLNGEEQENVFSKSVNSLFKNAKQCFERSKYISAYKTTLEIIRICKKEQNYTQLLFALFNANTLLFKLKFSISLDRNRFQNLIEFDLQEEFLQFPKHIIEKQQPLFDFLSLKSVYEQAYENGRDLIKINQRVSSIKNGGIAWNNDAEKPTLEHINLVLFVTRNHLIFNHEVFNQMMKYYLEISIARQSIKAEFNLNKFELYTCITYLDKNELISLCSNFSIKAKPKESLKLTISQNNIDWLVDNALVNILSLHIEADSRSEFTEAKLINIIKLLSYADLGEDRTEKVLKQFSRLISSNNTTIDIYEVINHFFAVQYNLYESSINKDLLIELIESIINKVVYRRANGLDNFAISGNRTSNLYDYAFQNNFTYTNNKLVKKLLNEISDKTDIKEKVRFSKTLLNSVHRIGNKDIKLQIRKFVSKLCNDYDSKSDDAFIFTLWSVAVGFLDEMPSTTVTDLDIYLNEFLDGRTFHGRFIEMLDVVQFLTKNKSLTSLEGIQSKLRSLVEKHNSRPNPSNI